MHHKTEQNTVASAAVYSFPSISTTFVLGRAKSPQRMLRISGRGRRRGISCPEIGIRRSYRAAESLRPAGWVWDRQRGSSCPGRLVLQVFLNLQ